MDFVNGSELNFHSRISMLFVAFITVGLLEACAVGLAFIAYMLFNGFLPGFLLGLSVRWYDDSVNDLVDSYGQEWASIIASQRIIFYILNCAYRRAVHGCSWSMR